MLSFLLSAFVISLSGVMLPGPMFAVTVAKSYKSPFTGIGVTIGHAIIEIPLMLLIYFGFAQFLYLGGSAMLFWLGIAMFKAKNRVIEKGQDLPYNSVTGGIMTTALNPACYLWWVIIGSMLIMNSLEFGIIGFALLIPVHLLCDAAWLLFISMLVYKTQSLWGIKFQKGLFTACSLLLIGFGGWFLVSGLQLVL